MPTCGHAASPSPAATHGLPVSKDLPLLGVGEMEAHVMRSLVSGFSHSASWCQCLFRWEHVTVLCPFSWPSDIPLDGPLLFIHSSVGAAWVVHTSWLLWTFLCGACRRVFLSFTCTYPGDRWPQGSSC